MNARPFSQPTVAHALCLALAKMNDAPELSPGILTQAVAPKFPDVPLPALQVIAAKVFALYFDDVSVPDIEGAGLDPAATVAALRFFSTALADQAATLEAELRQRRDSIVRAVQ